MIAHLPEAHRQLMEGDLYGFEQAMASALREVYNGVAREMLPAAAETHH